MQIHMRVECLTENHIRNSRMRIFLQISYPLSEETNPTIRCSTKNIYSQFGPFPSDDSINFPSTPVLSYPSLTLIQGYNWGRVIYELPPMFYHRGREERIFPGFPFLPSFPSTSFPFLQLVLFSLIYSIILPSHLFFFSP